MICYKLVQPSAHYYMAEAMKQLKIFVGIKFSQNTFQVAISNT